MLAVSALIKSRPLSQVRFSKLDTNNWKPLLAFRKRLTADEVEHGQRSIYRAGQRDHAARSIRNTAWSSASGEIQSRSIWRQCRCREPITENRTHHTMSGTIRQTTASVPGW